MALDEFVMILNLEYVITRETEGYMRWIGKERKNDGLRIIKSWGVPWVYLAIHLS